MNYHAQRGEYEQRLIEAAKARRARLMDVGIPPKPKPKVTPPQPPEVAPNSCFRPYSNKGKEVLAIAASKHNVSVNDILARTRLPNIVAARHEAMWMLRELCGFRHAKIAAVMERDHATVVNALTKLRRAA